MTYYLTPTIVAHRRDALSTPRTTAGLKPYEDGILEATIRAAKDGESAPNDFGISGADPQRLAEDVNALDALVPPPISQRDVCARMSWGGNRAAEALRAWRDSKRE